METRKYQRFNAEGEVVLKKKTNPAFSIQAHLFDISFAGMGMFSPEPLEAGCDCLIEFTVKPWQEQISGEGKIKHVQEVKKGDAKVFRIGIEFTSIDPKVIQNIINRIQQIICEETRRKEQPKTSPPHPRYF
jgi:c-di-GMP-binding flagellar brake protein YcgR